MVLPVPRHDPGVFTRFHAVQPGVAAIEQGRAPRFTPRAPIVALMFAAGPAETMDRP